MVSDARQTGKEPTNEPSHRHGGHLEGESRVDGERFERARLWRQRMFVGMATNRSRARSASPRAATEQDSAGERIPRRNSQTWQYHYRGERSEARTIGKEV